MCGEHPWSMLRTCAVAGSSPHVRGARRSPTCRKCPPGIIPACAGSTVGWVPCQVWCRDHPRMCGEHRLAVLCVSAPSGSSPHVRGARLHPGAVSAASGIIPACAGSTEDVANVASNVRDHPRMCGEHTSGLTNSRPVTGSSPHVRGAQQGGRLNRSRNGIIPACAGSTISYAILRFDSWDHPRMCGEHLNVNVLVFKMRGSSPHVRGAHR